MWLKRIKLTQLAIAIIAWTAVNAYAEHKDLAPLSDDLIQKIHKITRSPNNPVAEALNQHLESLNAIANDTNQSADAQRMLLAGKRAELKSLNKEAMQEIARMHQHYIDAGLSDRLPDFEKFTEQVKLRFAHLDRTLADIDAPNNRLGKATLGRDGKKNNRNPAIEALKSELDQLHNNRVKKEHLNEGVQQPTFIASPPPEYRDTPASSNVPKYLSQNPSSLNQYAYLGDNLLAAAPAIAIDAQNCGYTAADLAATPDAPQSIEITNLAAKLNYSAKSIYQYVHDNIRFEPYYGSLKGAVATLNTKAGGSTDQASLLIALLRASNIPARYVRGKVQMLDNPSDPLAVTGGRVAQWVGAKSYLGARSILRNGNFNSNSVSDGTNTLGIVFNQVWVEACVPYSHYRGASSDTSGERWIPLDPSYKDKTYQPGLTNTLVLDYTTYLSKLQNGPDSLPQESFAKQVEANVRSLDPSNTVQDVSYYGFINYLQLDTLPNSLPYDVINFTNWAGTSSPEIAQLPDDHRYAWYIGGLGFTPTGTNGFLKLNLPDVASKRVTLSFAGSTASDKTAISNWLSSGVTALPCTSTINVNPVIKVDGVTQVLPAGNTTTLCSTNNSLNMIVGLKELATGARTGDPQNIGQLNTASYVNIGGANYHALEAYAFQGSSILLNQRASNLVQAVEANTNPTFSDNVMDAIEGEYLNVIGLKYMRYITDARSKIGTLYGGSGQSGNHIGLVTTQMNVNYLFDLPFAVNSNGFLVDVLGGQSLDTNITSGDFNFDSFVLSGYASSAYESYVLQENAHSDAISTVRGLQYANQQGIGTLTGVNAANWGVCTTVGSNCYKLTNGPAPQYTAADISSIKTNFIDQGFVLTLPLGRVQYGNWLGKLFVATKYDATTKVAQSSFAISKLGGGWTVSSPVATNTYTPVTQSNFTSAPEIPIFISAPSTPTASVYNPTTPVNSTTATNGVSVSTTTAGDPVNMVNGNMYHQERDITIKGRGGLPLVFERFYNSRQPQDGPFGFGWTHSFNHFIKMYGVENGIAKLSWIDGTGREVYFSTTNQSAGNIPVNTVISNPSGIYVTFQRLANGTYTLREKNGFTYTFANINGPNQTASATATPLIAKLLSITDRNGNTISLNYTATATCTGGALLCSATDAIGHSLNFSYTNNRITKVTDFTGRAYQYAYADGNNNLTSFSNPLAIAGSQAPISYTYYTAADGASFNHLMQQYTLPRGNGMRFEYYANGRTFRHTVIQTDGSLSPDQINSFTYNDFRRETIQTNELGNERHFFFDAFGNPQQIVEENGATTRYTYDCADPSQAPGVASCKNPFNRLSKTGPDGYTTSYSYDSLGNITQVTTPRGATIQYVDYNVFNQARRIKDANGHWTINRYDAKGNQTDQIETASSYSPSSCASAECALPNSSQIKSWLSNGFDSVGNFTSTKRVRDFASQISNNSPSTDTGPLMLYGYDANQLNAITITRRGIKNTDSTASVVNTAILIYDSLGRLSTGIDHDWYTTQMYYDALDRITSATDKLGNLRNYRFDANGNPIGQSLKLTLAGQNTLLDSSATTYDSSDRTIANFDSAGNVTSYTYDAASNVLNVTNPDNYSISFDYDADNRPIHAYDQQNHAVYSTLDVSGRVRDVTDPNGNSSSNQYWDSTQDGRLKTSTLPKLANNGNGTAFTVGHQQQYNYDANGNIISITDIPATGSGQANRVSTTTYDELNRPVRSVRPAYTDAQFGLVCPVTLSVYDNLGRLTQLAAGYTPSPCATASSDVTKPQMSYAYDDFARQTTATDGNGKATSYVYDSNNNLSTRTDANLQTTSFTWSYGHQLSTRTEQGGRTTTYQRNAIGQITSISHPNASFSYEYDNAHRLSRATETRSGQASSKTMAYQWSPGGLLNSLTDTNGALTSYLYDPVGRLSGITTPNGDTVTLRFDAGGRLHEKVSQQGIVSLYQYNEDNSLASLTNRTAQANSTGTTTTALSSHTYSYDGFGQRINHNQTINSANSTSTINYSYNYDTLNRLTQVSNGNSSQTETDSYDPWHNRTSQQTGSSLTSYVYDNANQLTQIYHGTQATGTLTASLSYDNNGNLKSDGTRTYTWDALNQLAQVNLGSTITNYSYDDQGRRISKIYNSNTANSAANTSTYQYTYNGNNIYAEYGSSWNTPTALYSHLGTDQPMIRSTVASNSPANSLSYSANQYYAQDGLGSVVAAMNISNANTANPVTSIASQSFDAWGNQLSSTDSINQYGYTGREADEDGLIYYRARYRNPQTDRFLNRDPIGLGGGINQYSYVSGNPINDTDALGLTARSPLANMLVANDASYFTGVMSDVGQGLGNLAKSAANSAANGLNHVLDACGDFCDPGVQASIGDVPGAALIGGLRGLAGLGEAAASGARAGELVDKEIILSLTNHGEAAQHASDAIAKGLPDILTVDRSGTVANRSQSIGGLDKVPGMHLDEYPPAMFSEGGTGASVRAINPRDNMSAGACIGNSCRNLPNGARVKIKIGQ